MYVSHKLSSSSGYEWEETMETFLWDGALIMMLVNGDNELV